MSPDNTDIPCSSVPGGTRGVSLFLQGHYGKYEPQEEVTLKYTVEAALIPEIFTQPSKEIGWFSPIVSFLWHIFLGLQVVAQHFL